MDKIMVAKRKLESYEAGPDDPGIDPGQVGPDSGGQSGDAQGLSSTASVTNESIEELAADDQALEASFVDGVAAAGDHPERPVHTHERKQTTV